MRGAGRLKCGCSQDWPMPPIFLNIGHGEGFVGQTSRSARVLQDPLFAHGISHVRARTGRRGRRPQDWSPAPGKIQVAQNGKTSGIGQDWLLHITRE